MLGEEGTKEEINEFFDGGYRCRGEGWGCGLGRKGEIV